MEKQTLRKPCIPHGYAESSNRHLRECLAVWGLEALAREIELKISTRMIRTIGSANAAHNRITLAVWLFDQPRAIIDEVLCHEAAHLAVYHLHGSGCRPHGREWQDLMRRSGLIPRVRIPLPNPPSIAKNGLRRRRSPLSRVAALIRW